MHQVPDDLKVGIAKMYLKGKADIWFHGFITNHPNTDEVIEVFSKLRQKETIAEYQEQFEELKSRVMLALPHLPESYYISIFTSGLREEIKSMVKIIKLSTLAKAFEVALLQENTITALNKGTKPYEPYSQAKFNYTTNRTSEATHKTTPQSGPNPKNSINPLKFKAITPFNFQTKKELGLCYK